MSNTLKIYTMNKLLVIIAVLAVAAFSSCKSNQSAGLPNDGQLHGVSLEETWLQVRTPGMIYVTHENVYMGLSDEDVN